MRKRLLTILFTLSLCLGCAVSASASGGELVVYYTNDIHSYIDNAMEDENDLTYSKLAALKQSTPGALLVDAGDQIQGTSYGDLDNGETVIRPMNAGQVLTIPAA